MDRDSLKASLWAALVSAALAGLIVAGSRNLAHFDAALVGYTFAMLFAAFGITYRYAMWLQRPPTRDVLAARLAGVLPARSPCGGNLVEFGRRFVAEFAAQSLHLAARQVARGLAHWLIMWGCLIAVGDHVSARLRLGPLRDACPAI